MSTYFEKNIDQNKKSWHIFDAKDQILGRLASEVAKILIGKHRPNFTKHVDTGDFVVVINADKVALTGRKWAQKMYYDHSGYVSGLKEKTATEMMERHPDELIRRAVWGMVNKTKLGKAQMTKLKIYAGADHPHKAQSPKVATLPARKKAK